MRKGTAKIYLFILSIFIFAGCNMKQDTEYKIYEMNEAIEIYASDENHHPKIFKTYVQPQVGGNLVESLFEITIISDAEETIPLEIYITPYGCNQITSNPTYISHKTLNVLQTYKVYKGEIFNYQITDDFRDLLKENKRLNKVIDTSAEERIIWKAPEVFNVTLSFEFELKEPNRGILTVN